MHHAKLQRPRLHSNPTVHEEIEFLVKLEAFIIQCMEEEDGTKFCEVIADMKIMKDWVDKLQRKPEYKQLEPDIKDSIEGTISLYGDVGTLRSRQNWSKDKKPGMIRSGMEYITSRPTSPLDDVVAWSQRAFTWPTQSDHPGSTPPKVRASTWPSSSGGHNPQPHERHPAK